MNLGNIPGFYWDEEKKKYFRIQQNHQTTKPSNEIAKYCKEFVQNANRKKKEFKRKIKRQKIEAAQTIKRSRVLRSPLHFDVTLGRELGLSSNRHRSAAQAFVDGLSPHTCIDLANGGENSTVNLFQFRRARQSMFVASSVTPGAFRGQTETSLWHAEIPLKDSVEARNQDYPATPTTKSAPPLRFDQNPENWQAAWAREGHNVAHTALEISPTGGIISACHDESETSIQFASPMAEWGGVGPQRRWESYQYSHSPVEEYTVSAAAMYEHEEGAPWGDVPEIVMLATQDGLCRFSWNPCEPGSDGFDAWGLPVGIDMLHINEEETESADAVRKHRRKNCQRDLYAVTWLDTNLVAAGGRLKKVVLYDRRTNWKWVDRFTHDSAITHLRSGMHPSQIIVAGIEDSMKLYDLRMNRRISEREKRVSCPVFRFEGYENRHRIRHGFDAHRGLGMVATGATDKVQTFCTQDGKFLGDVRFAKLSDTARGDGVPCVRFLDFKGETSILAAHKGVIYQCAW